MDLIYSTHEGEDVGVLQDYSFDLELGAEANNFECTVLTDNNVCAEGYRIYFEGTEYGGIVDQVRVNTSTDEITYIGRTWHGVLEHLIIEPDAGSDYLTVSGDTNDVLRSVINRLGVTDLFVVAAGQSGINVTYKFDRYTDAYKGICKMLKTVGAKMVIRYERGKAVLYTERITDYKTDIFDTDKVAFQITKGAHTNHVICLGPGELSARMVIDVYADENGNIVNSKTVTGADEITEIYDFSNAESAAELRAGGEKVIKESWDGDEVKFSFNSNDDDLSIGDKVSATERITGISVTAFVSAKVVTIKNGDTVVSYKTEGK